MADNGKHTVIENGTEIDGSVRSQCPVALSGKVDGQLEAPSLTVTASGSVRGRVKVRDLKSHGEVSGQIEAQSVELCGRVNDQTVIHAKTLEVKLADQNGGLQVTFGNCELRVGDKAADKTAKGVEQQVKSREPQGVGTL
jgi:cytoskeletal protein CcmA (bactofilin family)